MDPVMVVRSRATRPLLALALAAPLGFGAAVLAPAVSFAATGFEAPPPNRIYQLDKQNRSRPWLRITADSTRWTVRVHRFDEIGPRGLEGRRDEPPAPGLLPWSSVARIDEVVTRAQRGRTLGFLAGGALGLGLGNAIGASDGSGWSEGMIGLLIAGSAGGWIGGRWGESMVREEPWYVAAPAPLTAEPAAPVAARAASDSAAGSPAAPMTTTTPAAAVADSAARAESISRSPRVLRACAKIDRRDLIRVRGDFGLFQGFAAVAGPQGLDGLRPDPRQRHATTAVPEGLVSWDRIALVDKRGSSAGRGAVMGGLSAGIAGGLISFAIVSALDSGGGSGNAVGGMFLGGAITGGFGALIGALLGAAVPAWHNVYDGP